MQNEKKKADEKEHKSIWQVITDRLLGSSLFDTRAGRAGLVFNPLRGLILNQKYPISPFAPVTNPEDGKKALGTGLVLIFHKSSDIERIIDLE